MVLDLPACTLKGKLELFSEFCDRNLNDLFSRYFSMTGKENKTQDKFEFPANLQFCLQTAANLFKK